MFFARLFFAATCTLCKVASSGRNHLYRTRKHQDIDHGLPFGQEMKNEVGNVGKLIHVLVIRPQASELACKSRKSSMPSMASAWPCVTSRASMLLTPYFGNVCKAACGRQRAAMSFLQRSGDDRNNKTIHDHTQPYSEIHPMYTAESIQSKLQNVVRRSCINLEDP